MAIINKSYFLFVVLLLTACGSSGGSSSSSESNQAVINVDVPDKVLRKNVLHQLGFSDSQQLTDADIKKIKVLAIPDGESIANLAGLEYAVNLTELTLRGDLIDLSPLNKLAKLSKLHFIATPKIKLSTYARWSGIQLLQISYSPGVDLTPLDGASFLSDLQLDHNELSDIPALSIYSNIFNTLDFSHNKLSNYSTLSRVPFLYVKNLYLNANPIQFAEPVNTYQYTNALNILDVLDLSDTAIATIDEIGGANESVNVSNTCIDVDHFSYLKNFMDSDKSKTKQWLYTHKDDAAVFAATGLHCPSSRLDNAVIETHVYSGTYKLQIDVNFFGADFPAKKPGQCELYFDPQLPVLGAPDYSVLCSYRSAMNLDLPAKRPASITLVYRDGYGKSAQKNIDVPPVETNVIPLTHLSWGQSVVKENLLLVVNRTALMRFTLESDLQQASPSVDILLELYGLSTQLTPLVADSSSEYLGKKYSIYSVPIPAEWMQPTLEIKIAADNKLPVSVKPDFAVNNVLYLTVVPSEINGIAPVIPSEEVLRKSIAGFWPFSEVNIRMHPLFRPGLQNDSGLLAAITDLKNIEGEENIYYGFYPGPGGGVASGLASVGANTQGLEYGEHAYLQEWEQLMLHELGHNLNRPHVDCGGPAGPDLNYPHATYTTGVLGISGDLTTFFQPKRSEFDVEGFSDVMSYCHPKHVSDYVYESVQRDYQINPTPAFKSVVAQKQKTQANVYYISGSIQSENSVRLDRMIPLDHLVDVAPSGYEMRVRFSDAREIKSPIGLMGPVFDNKNEELQKSQHFFATIPVGDIERLEVTYKGTVIYSQNNSPTSMQQQKKSAVKTNLQEGANWVCVDGGSDMFLSLMHRSARSTTLLIAEDGTGHACASTEQLSGGEWVLVSRAGLHVESQIIPRNN